MKKLLVFLTLIGTLMAEDDIFADPFADGGWDEAFEVEEVESSSSIADVTLNIMEERIGFSGQVEVKSEFVDFDKEGLYPLDGVEYKDQLSSQIKANFFLDIRLEEGTKAYGSFEVYKNANPNLDRDDLIKVQELFLDFNIENKAYFRLGQQNLAWGRGYFFNPTDLVNYEKKTLRNLDDVRQGSFGAKLHIPRGVSQNFYAYVGLDTVEEPKDLGLALKYEFLVKNSEFSLSAYGKKDFQPVLGFDFSTGFKGASIFGEARINRGDDIERYEDGSKDKLDDEYIVKASVGYQKSFDYKDEDGKFNLIQEFYYNSNGYGEDDLDRDFLTKASDLFKPFDFGYYYLANFFTINEFISDDLSFTINTVSNLSDESHSAQSSLTYKMHDKLNITGSFQAFLGDDLREMTISNIDSITSLSVNLTF